MNGSSYYCRVRYVLNGEDVEANVYKDNRQSYFALRLGNPFGPLVGSEYHLGWVNLHRLWGPRKYSLKSTFESILDKIDVY